MQIGTYCLNEYARTEEHIKELADCGIDFVVGVEYHKPTLDLLAQYGLGAVISGLVPSWFGGEGTDAGKMSERNPMECYREGAKEYRDHPAIVGIDIGDEPSSLDFPYYGKVYETVSDLFRKEPYLNLYASYGMVYQEDGKNIGAELGTEDYREYIERYCTGVPSGYIGFDFYPYSATIDLFYESLEAVSNACRRYDRSMRTVLQVNSNRPEEWISENQLRFQAYSAMAFGTNMILWACYTAGWWHNQVLDQNGEKTEQYSKLQKINREIKYLAKEYDKYQSYATVYTGWDKPERINMSGFAGIKASNDSPLLIGYMKERSGSKEALFILAADDPYDKEPKEIRIAFEHPGKGIKVYGGNGELSVLSQGEGRYAITLVSNEGVLITAE